MALAGPAIPEWDWKSARAIAFREARRVLRHDQDAEDAAQEALIRALRHWDQCVHAADPDAWIRSIARREAYRIFGARATKQVDGALASDASMPDPADTIANRLVAQDAVKLVTVNDRSLLLRRYVLEQSSREIAFEVGVPASTVRVRLHRATERIRNQVSHPWAI